LRISNRDLQLSILVCATVNAHDTRIAMNESRFNGFMVTSVGLGLQSRA
jgi:hypothetical protein